MNRRKGGGRTTVRHSADDHAGHGVHRLLSGCGRDRSPLHADHSPLGMGSIARFRWVATVLVGKAVQAASGARPTHPFLSAFTRVHLRFHTRTSRWAWGPSLGFATGALSPRSSASA